MNSTETATHQFVKSLAQPGVCRVCSRSLHHAIHSVEHAETAKPDVNRVFALAAIQANPHFSAIYNELLDALRHIASNLDHQCRTLNSIDESLLLAEAAIRKAKGKP